MSQKPPETVNVLLEIRVVMMFGASLRAGGTGKMPKDPPPGEVQGVVDSVLRQFVFESNTPVLRQQVLKSVEAVLSDMKFPDKYEVVINDSEESIKQNMLNVTVRERSVVDQLGDLVDDE